MNPLEFIFALLRRFVTFTEKGKAGMLQNQAETWASEQKSKNGIVAKVLKGSEIWYVQVAIAFFFFIAVKWIAGWMVRTQNPNLLDQDGEYDEDEDEEEEDDEPARPAPKKFAL